MNSLDSIIQELLEAAEHPGKTVRQSMEKSGKKAIGCFPIYAPEELVYAAGMLPVGLWGGPTRGNLCEQYLQSFCCSVMRANTEQAMKGQYNMLSGVILTAYCDTLKCIMEDWKTAVPQLNLMPMVYPQNRKIQAGKEFLKEEFTRILRQLEQICGRSVSRQDLKESIEVYDEYRKTMQEFVFLAGKHSQVIGAKARHQIIKAAFFLDKKEYTEKIAKINGLLAARNQGQNLRNQGQEESKLPIVLTGLLSEPIELLSFLDENGFAVVGDDLAQESRQFCNLTPEGEDGISRLAERIALQDGCAFLFEEEKSRGERLVALCEERKAVGVVVIQMKFCDPEEFDYPIYKKALEKAGLPLLYLEVEQHMDSMEQIRTRIQSFAEVLRA